MLQHGNSDPFPASSVQITPLNHCLLSTWQTIFPAEVFQKAPTATVTCKNDGPDMISRAERLHFLLAWTLMLKLSSMPLSKTKTQLEVVALTHKAKGLKSFQMNLTSMSKVAFIQAIWHLMEADFYGGNILAAIMNFRAMVTMVESIGGLKELSWELRMLVIVADMTVAAATGDRNSFAADEWDPGSVTPTVSESEEDLISSILSIQPPLHESMPNRLVSIFESYRELLAVHRITTDLKDTSRLTALILWTQMRQNTLSVCVTSMRAYLAELPAFAKTFLDKAICVAVDYFLQILWWKNHPERTVHAPFHHSEGSLEILRDSTQLEPSSLTLWILFIATPVELVLRRRGHMGTTFLAQFGNMFECLLGGVVGLIWRISERVWDGNEEA